MINFVLLVLFYLTCYARRVLINPEKLASIYQQSGYQVLMGKSILHPTTLLQLFMAQW